MFACVCLCECFIVIICSPFKSVHATCCFCVYSTICSTLRSFSAIAAKSSEESREIYRFSDPQPTAAGRQQPRSVGGKTSSASKPVVEGAVHNSRTPASEQLRTEAELAYALDWLLNFISNEDPSEEPPAQLSQKLVDSVAKKVGLQGFTSKHTVKRAREVIDFVVDEKSILKMTVDRMENGELRDVRYHK
eukprot:Opistho-2@3118